MTVPAWEAAEAALWSWLEGAPGFSALGLHKFKGYLGERLAVTAQGPTDQLFDPADLPAIYCEAAGQITVAPLASQHLEDAVPLRLGIVAACPTTTPSRTSFETAVQLVRNRLLGKDARLLGIGDIFGIVHRGETLVPLARPTSRVVQFWHWEISLALSLHSLS